MSDQINAEELELIKKNCQHWANNCGGCETCSREFAIHPPYDHKETFYLVDMIERRNNEIASLRIIAEKSNKLVSELKARLAILSRYHGGDGTVTKMDAMEALSPPVRQEAK